MGFVGGLSGTLTAFHFLGCLAGIEFVPELMRARAVIAPDDIPIEDEGREAVVDADEAAETELDVERAESGAR